MPNVPRIRNIDKDNNTAISQQNQLKQTARATDQNNIEVINENRNSIDRSGNSDVDVHVDVHVDTAPIGFAILCSLLATKQMSHEEFEAAVRRLEEMTQKQNYIYMDQNNPSKAKIYGNQKKLEWKEVFSL